MNIRLSSKSDINLIVPLIANFRVELFSFKGKEVQKNLEYARNEFSDYLDKGYPVYVAECDNSSLIGYIVCKVEGNVVWAESLYVSEKYRRQGVASALYIKAEELSRSIGGETVYNWVHPNNKKIISFLEKRGYNVLNLIEIRKSRDEEMPLNTISVGSHKFKY